MMKGGRLGAVLQIAQLCTRDTTPELYPACSRCTWHAGHVQREYPTLRGMLTGRPQEAAQL